MQCNTGERAVERFSVKTVPTVFFLYFNFVGA